MSEVLQLRMFAVFGLMEYPLRARCSSSPVNLSYLLGPGFLIITNGHWLVQVWRMSWSALSEWRVGYFSAEAKGLTASLTLGFLLLLLLEVICRWRSVDGLSEQPTGAGSEAHLYVAERGNVLLVVGVRALGLGGMEAPALGKGPQLLGMRPVYSWFGDLLPAFLSEWIASSHLLNNYNRYGGIR